MAREIKILNLYAGIGGNRKLWSNCQITAVENDAYIAQVYKQLYPQDTVIVGDAHQYLLDNLMDYDFIWSSPPCPTHSRARYSLKGYGLYVYPDMKLYEEIIFLKHFFEGKWVVENVVPYYKPLIEPTVALDRHYFWSNFDIKDKEFRRGYRGRVTDMTKETLAAEYNIALPKGTKYQRKLLRNAVRPEIGKYILDLLKNNGGEE